ncbi:excisionase family DNA binding protein [Sinorhizobium meliloti]|uniref:helix-turn-helix domain-containing protein n=1 Tax=Rhizobium meliloti TaxID=382 RepID=UPI000D118416|nr:helix-turn-helix domain-containing protein [Sinorhizobium meliloti]MBP2464790.1 excisionase family DNA binding protein [Sinorhizobium meliloti]MQW83412.1 helix-turn-helix domain-containing protein [Sinorhizobium meliloti]PST29521.1 DNA-binding protein [Mesorhizobium loti]GEC36486.1 DNA-binding protein [Sinorhizobium meliloti]
MSEILTVREVAALLKINEKTAYKLAAKGEIPGFKVGGSWRFDSGEIDSWIRRESAKHGKGDDAEPKEKKQ